MQFTYAGTQKYERGSKMGSANIRRLELSIRSSVIEKWLDRRTGFIWMKTHLELVLFVFL